MYKLSILPAAKQDIKEAAIWYNNQKSGLGMQFTKAIRADILNIKINPFAFSLKYKNLRGCAVDRFPYIIHFIIEESQKRILITSVFHTSRNPKIWNQRLK